MINAAKELARTVGHEPAYVGGVVTPIISGQFVKFSETTGKEGESGSFLVAATGSDTGDILGIAADDTKKLPFNGMYEIIDNYFKNGKVAAFVLGGMFTIWNDGRGAVFAANVHKAKAGTPLYIGSDGTLSTVAGSPSTIGAEVVGSVLRAPETADGTLFFKAKGL